MTLRALLQRRVAGVFKQVSENPLGMT